MVGGGGIHIGLCFALFYHGKHQALGGSQCIIVSKALLSPSEGCEFDS